MTTEEAILAKLSQVLERLELLESMHAETVVIQNGTVNVYSGEHAPVLVAEAGELQIKVRRDVTVHIGGDLKGEIRTHEGQLRVKTKGAIGGASTETGKVEVISKKGDVTLDLELPESE
jgi:cytoskeletal protein CcmA (bactofilin family)